VYTTDNQVISGPGRIRPSTPNACLDGIWATNATLLRLNIHGVLDV
jgi:hypothetical protein